MTPTLFDVFKQIEMTYQVIQEGTVYGRAVAHSKTVQGVFKQRDGEVSVRNAEVATSAATAHLHPEDFGEGEILVGNGLQVNGVDYRITGQTVGRNFETGKDEHITVTLERSTNVDD